MCEAICGIRRVDRLRSNMVRERCGRKRSIFESAEEGMLKCLRHMEMMN